MATMSLGVFSSFLGGETASLAKSSSLSSSSLWLGVRSLPTSQANLRAVTSATASKPWTATQKREPRGIMKPGRVSPEMQAFLGGVSEIPRTQVLKQIWAYIKQHNLQFDMCGMQDGRSQRWEFPYIFLFKMQDYWRLFIFNFRPIVKF
ncbi:hypothetical protein CsSME_00009716 [Camellia sinensis var. sinensis]